jgi:hypothetical protein
MGYFKALRGLLNIHRPSEVFPQPVEAHTLRSSELCRAPGLFNAPTRKLLNKRTQVGKPAQEGLIRHIAPLLI